MSSIESFDQSRRYTDYLSGNRIPFPDTLHLELTTRHTTNCSCPSPLFRKESDTGQEVTIHDDTLEYILTSILPYVQQLHLSGRGDPVLAEEQLIKTLEYADFFSVPVILETHGLTISDAVLKAIQNQSVQKLVVFLNAPDDDNHKKICGCSILPLIEFLETLTGKPAGRLPELHFRTVLVHENIPLLPELINVAYRYGALSLTITPMCLTEDSEKVSAFRYYRDMTEEMFYRCLIESEMKGLTLKTDPEQLLDALGSVEDIEQYLSGQVPPSLNGSDMVRDCSCFWNETVIDVNGQVLPCFGDHPPVGLLERQSFQDIWYSDGFRSIRRNYLSDFSVFTCNACHHPVWQKKKPARSGIMPDDSNFYLFPGWFDRELEERSFRYTKDHAAVFLKRDKSHLFALVQIRKASFEGASEKGTIVLNQTDTFPYELPGNQWETLELPLPDNGSSDDLVSIEFIPDQTIRPRQIHSDYQDCRSLGVKVAKIWLETWEKKVVYAQQLVLLGYDVLPEILEVDGDIIFRTYWRTLSRSDFDVKILVELVCTDETTSQKHLASAKPTDIQHDYLLSHRNLPSSNWPAGTFIAHEHCFPIPDSIPSGHYKLSLGVYPEGEPKKRLKITRSDREHSGNIALLGTVLISNHTAD